MLNGEVCERACDDSRDCGHHRGFPGGSQTIQKVVPRRFTNPSDDRIQYVTPKEINALKKREKDREMRVFTFDTIDSNEN